ncbi:MAG: hypothetical protein KAR39_13350, partial [Thermoplasmata archaeon]|nr:hypothetical protein [Thermoplasmata archaeon]
MDLYLILSIIGGVVGVIGFLYGFTKRQPKIVLQPVVDSEALKKELAGVPGKVLQALKSSTSNIRGSMA